MIGAHSSSFFLSFRSRLEQNVCRNSITFKDFLGSIFKLHAGLKKRTFTDIQKEKVLLDLSLLCVLNQRMEGISLASYRCLPSSELHHSCLNFVKQPT